MVKAVGPRAGYAGDYQAEVGNTKGMGVGAGQGRDELGVAVAKHTAVRHARVQDLSLSAGSVSGLVCSTMQSRQTSGLG